MTKLKKKTFENWTMPNLRSALMERMGDLLCFVWDAKQPNVENLALALGRVERSSKKCKELLTEINRRNFEQA